MGREKRGGKEKGGRGREKRKKKEKERKRKKRKEKKKKKGKERRGKGRIVLKRKLYTEKIRKIAKITKNDHMPFSNGSKLMSFEGVSPLNPNCPQGKLGNFSSLEIAGAKAQICTCAAAQCTRVCQKTVYKNIERAQLSAELGQNCALI